MGKYGEPQGRTSLPFSRSEDTDSQQLHMKLRVVGLGAELWEHCKDAEGVLGHPVKQVQC